MDFKSLRKTLAITAVSIGVVIGAYNVGLSQRPSYKQLSPAVQKTIQNDLTAVKPIIELAFQQISAGALDKALQSVETAARMWSYISQLLPVEKDKEYTGMSTRLFELRCLIRDIIFSQNHVVEFTKETNARIKGFATNEERSTWIQMFAEHYDGDDSLPVTLLSPRSINDLQVERLAWIFRIQYLKDVVALFNDLEDSYRIDKAALGAIIRNKDNTHTLIRSSERNLAEIDAKLK